MRYSILVLVLCLAMSALARAEAPAFHAGMTRISVQDDVPFEAIVWYPTMAEETITPIGPWPVAAAMDAPIAGGGRLPVVLLSHGSGGSPWVHRDLASHQSGPDPLKKQGEGRFRGSELFLPGQLQLEALRDHPGGLAVQDIPVQHVSPGLAVG